MKGKIGDRQRLQHILDSIEQIEEYTKGVNEELFMNNSMMRFACIKQIEIIGEAANHLTIETQSLINETEWAKIKGMRNVLVHEYFGILEKIIWQVISSDLHPLKIKIQQVLSKIP